MKNLILLHGAIGASDQLEKIKEILNKSFNIYTFDFEGHGIKSESELAFSIPHFAENLNQFIIDHKISNPNIFGYSMGGYVSIYYLLHFKNNVEKVFTFATKFNWTPEVAINETKMLDASVIKNKIPAFAQALENRHGNHWENMLLKTQKMMLEMGTQPPLSATEMNQITIPVQFGLGDQDKMVSLEETLSFKNNCKNSTLLILPNTEHPIEKINTDSLCFHIQSFFN